MKKSKIIAIILSLALAVSLFASCANTAKYKNETVTAKITSIESGKATLTVVTADESSQQPPEMPDGENPGNGDGEQAPPEKPDGDTQDGDTQDSEDSSRKAPPEKPDSDTQDTANGSESTGSKKERKSKSADTTSTDAQSAENESGNSSRPEPPEKPEGEAGESGEAGNMPTPPDMAGQQTYTETDVSFTLDLSSCEIVSGNEALSVSDLKQGDIVSVTFNSKGKPEKLELLNGSVGGSFGASQAVEQGTSANTVSEDSEISKQTYTSEGDDENALRIDGATVTLDSVTVNKSAGSSSNTESGDFYGMNAALLATNGATLTIKNSSVSSSAQNGNGVFSYGSGTTVNISDSTITTTADNSGGIQTTGGGTTNATNLNVKTSGNSSAAIRSDRGGGTVNVDKGTYESNGYNSPAVYSTADITVKNATLTANNSEALVIEGQNSITLENCNVTGNMSDTKGSSSDENVHNVMIYQSMSGDAEVGTSKLTVNGGTLTSKNGDMFYVTNTDSEISLTNVNIVNNDRDSYLFNITGNSASHGWGTAGKNGANVTLNCSSQTLEGDIRVDSVSTLKMTLSDSSSFTGTINIADNEQNGEAVSDNAVLVIEEGSSFTLTGNCTLTSLENHGTINFNGYTITLADGTVLK